MAILVRDDEIDAKVRVLAQRYGTTLQAAIGRAVDNDLKRLDERRARIENAFRRVQERVAAFPILDDGMTHKEFFDREYGDA